ncbi:hypothetical protein [Fictibacillus sp. NRS-1165]|uniref:hypothetical protein n=1 Tax=Fictibacillus sp. NRS-1165 TaxID=3144463 RepID=UPI003D219597
MKTCPYCGSEVVRKKRDAYSLGVWTCQLCVMKVNPVEDGARSNKFEIKQMISEDDCRLPLSELMTYHTFDLLLVLRILRQQRRENFDLMRTIKKADSPEYREGEQIAANEYELITRRMWAVENLLLERVGYIPEVISEKYLEKYLERMSEDKNHKPMQFKKSFKKSS